MNPLRQWADALTGRALVEAKAQMQHDSAAARKASQALREASGKLDQATTQLRESLHKLGELPADG